MQVFLLILCIFHCIVVCAFFCSSFCLLSSHLCTILQKNISTFLFLFFVSFCCSIFGLWLLLETRRYVFTITVASINVEANNGQRFFFFSLSVRIGDFSDTVYELVLRLVLAVFFGVQQRHRKRDPLYYSLERCAY